MGFDGARVRGEGRRVLVTGADEDLGARVARALAAAGAEVLLGCRDRRAGSALAAELGGVPVHDLDPARLASVHRLAGALAAGPPLDAVVHAAGAPAAAPELDQRHLAPFALTGLVLPRLVASGAGRVVVVTAAPAPEARLRLDDDAGDTDPALASLLTTFELQRRFEKERLPVRCVACTPGASPSLPGWAGRWGRAWGERRWRTAVAPVVVATLADGVVGGDWLSAGRGTTVERREPPVASRDVRLARRLVVHSEQVTGVAVG